LQGYQTSYQTFFSEKDYPKNDEEIEVEKGVGSELIHYLKNLYYNPHTNKDTRVLYTTSRCKII
jgi:hypothetical protein